MSPRFQRFLWLGFALAVLLATGLWALGVSERTIEAQRRLVPVSTVWGMHACVVAIVAGLGAIAVPVARILGRRRLLTALVLVIIGALACGLAPRTTRIFFDEHIYAQIGQTIAHTGRAENVNYARAQYGKLEVYDAVTNKQPNGLPYLLSWIFRVVGVSDEAAHFLNPALVGLTAAALYLGLALVPWTLPAGAGLAAALLFVFTPLVLWWGHTVAVEPGAAANATLAFFAVCAYARLRDRGTAQGGPAAAMLLAGATGFAVYFRPESVLVFPLVAAVLWSTDDRFIEDVSAWGALALAIALAAPNVMHLWSMREESWGARDGRRFALDFVQKNLASNGGYFTDLKWFPIAGTVLAGLGALWLLKRNRTAGLALGLWFLFSWGVFVLFYAGGYYYGASSRYAVVSCAPVAVFMGIGLTAAVARLRSAPLLGWGLAAAGLISWVASMHYVPTRSREAIEAQADVDFVARIAPTLPTGSLVVSSDPCVWLLQGVSASQFYTVEHMMREELGELVNQYPGGIYIHWGFWHNAEAAAAEVTARLLVEDHAAVVARTQSEAYKLALYRLDTPEALARPGVKPPLPLRPQTDLDAVMARVRAGSTPAPSQ
ncbi:MAG TPA: glycosyltransferase family 39 protein [Opitutaceae bacterium]|nr:glycosyltransferase family 39 protein [Opitutaceae bacterium]